MTILNQTKKLRLYLPHATQRLFHELKARYRVVAWGRQSGKSTAALNEILRQAWENPNHTYWFVSPTLNQARKMYRRMVSMLFRCRGIMLKKNQTELRVKLINMTQIEFKSGEVFNNLLGDALHGVVIDECREQPRELWTRIIQPMLRTTRGWAAFISTTNGFDWFYDLAEKAKADRTGRWAFMTAPSTANPLITEAEMAEARAEMSDAEYRQEMLAEFIEIAHGTVYVSHGPWNQLEQNPFAAQGQKWSPHLPIIVGMDFNVGLMVWELAQARGRRIHFGDEIALPWSGAGESPSQAAAKRLAEKVKGHKQGIVIVGDASGKARKTSAAETDYQIILETLRAAGVTVRNLTPDQNPAVKDRVNVMNAVLRDASGGVNLTYSPTDCPRLKKDYQRVKWKSLNGESHLDKSDAELTHASDAAGYPVFHFCNSFRSRPGRMVVIQNR